jgi:uncharacterized membrane protein
MDQYCIIRGRNFPENEGMFWQQLRPSLQEYLKTLNSGWDASSFISYNALNDLLRAYISEVASQELKEHQVLVKKVQDRFVRDDTLRPIRHSEQDERLNFGERLADKIAEFGGSWPFIIIFFTMLLTWMAINVVLLRSKAFDPYPFILLNLVLSCLAAVQAPVIMMSQNRQGKKDRQQSEYDFRVNLKAETEVQLLHEKLDYLLLHHHRNMVELFQLQVDLMQQLQSRLDLMEKKQSSSK